MARNFLSSFGKNNLGPLRSATQFQESAVAREIGGRIDSYVDGITEEGFTNYGTNAVSGGGSILYYPSDLLDPEQIGRPSIRFTAFERTDAQGGMTMHNIVLPCPSNISFNESAQFNSFNLGALGAASTDALSSASDAFKGSLDGSDDSAAAAEAAINAFGSKVTEQAKGLESKHMLQLGLAATGVGSELQSAVSANTKTAINPNTSTAFSGNGLRNFNFEFKMIARSAQEARMINNIHKLFRKFSYAATDDNAERLILDYPPAWNIRFLELGQVDNRYIPKIFSCYLTSFQTTFNGSIGSFHPDGAPLEVDISIGYQETRVLTREDIEALERPMGYHSIIGDVGVGASVARAQSEGGTGIVSDPFKNANSMAGPKFRPKKDQYKIASSVLSSLSRRFG